MNCMARSASCASKGVSFSIEKFSWQVFCDISSFSHACTSGSLWSTLGGFHVRETEHVRFSFQAGDIASGNPHDLFNSQKHYCRG